MNEFPAPPRIHVLWVPGADPQRDAIVSQLSNESDTCIHTDGERRGVMANWLDALTCAKYADRDLPWTVILSDDALPLRGWQQHLERACMHSPHPLLGLTHFGRFGERALLKGVPYAEGPTLIWGGAVAYHRSVVPGLLEWVKPVAETGYPHDDWAVIAYAMRTNRSAALAARAIFGQPVKKSLLNHNTPIREPATTIENAEGPAWSSKPRAVPVSRSVPDSVRELSTFAPSGVSS